MVHPDELGEQLRQEAEDEAKEKAEKEHREKYPMCARLSSSRKEMLTLTRFVEWLQETKGFDLIDQVASHEMSLEVHRLETLLFEYFEIDHKELEKERRKMLEEQRAMNKEK